MGSSFGQLFRISTWGESHGGGVGVVVDGCPPRVPLAAEDLQVDLDRRRPGQSRLTTPRQEEDRAEILSGVFEGQTLGTPIAVLVRNRDARPEAYEDFKDVYRPSHADYTYQAKYGIRAWMGGGRASARETIGRVAAGAIARKVLEMHGYGPITAWVSRVRDTEARVDPLTVTRADVDAGPTRCPDAEAAAAMEAQIDEARRAGDSLGGTVSCVALGVAPGLGDPVFDKLEADLAKGMLSLPACKGFEIGSGFAGTRLKGSEHNDAFYAEEGQVRTRDNRSGGVQGGISNGEPVVIRVAFKPTATIRIEQETVNQNLEPARLAASGRHDPCVLPRAVPMVEAMVALVLCDHLLRQKAISKP
ncbi:MAG: chorismate synthase [Deltaproteobacteria bacterium]|nr:chorismate synthase [Deltaproteobacteria bacterium]MBW2413184.1 chorismate synthase [Deltaproteobacteria bacterium]